MNKNKEQKMDFHKEFYSICMEYGEIYGMRKDNFLGYKIKAKETSILDTYMLKIKLFFKNKTFSGKFPYRYNIADLKLLPKIEMQFYAAFERNLQQACEERLPVLLAEQLADGYFDLNLFEGAVKSDASVAEYIEDALEEIGVKNDNISNK